MGADLAAEEQFGPYLVYERLGVGGMATVHRALERGIEGFERIVALKRLLPHLAEDASFIKSFVREAKLASLLNHHNIVQIYELGRVGTEYFISMEYIDGRDIRRILRHARKVSGAPPIHVTVGLLIQLAEALDYAHTKSDEDGRPLGLIHRDVSPSNLLVNPAGHLKVIDFGIARAQSSQLRTQTGRVKGKLAYMAPEAVSSAKDLDARSDLWAVGVIAHELLTARPLFACKNEYQTLLKVQRGDIALPSTFNQATPPRLDAIVLKLLARDPDERFLDAASLREALIDLRRALKLQTGHRDVATWLSWAFSLEAPTAGFGQGTGDRSGGSGAFDLRAAAASLAGMSAHVTPTPKPRREDDEAVEIAWGGGEVSAVSEPIELDDVPDVSSKHLGAAPRDFSPTSDVDDDIPASEPSHGILRPKRDTAPQPTTIDPGLLAPAVPPPSGAPVRPTSPALSSKVKPASEIRTLPLPAPDITPPPEPRERRSTARGVRARPDTQERPSGVLAELPIHARSLSEMSPAVDEEIVRDTQPSISAVRFREPSKPPPVVDNNPTARTAAVDEPAADPPERRTLDDMVDPELATQPNVRRKRFSDDPGPRSKPITIGEAVVSRESIRSRAWIWIIALVVVGGAAAAVVLFAFGGEDGQVADSRDRTAEVAVADKRGTVKFVVEPDDVSIQIEGQVHVGSPWSVELAPGVHQIELRRDGFKPRVTSIELSPNETQTLLVTLEKVARRVGRDMNSQATLILDSEPPGLDIVLDGTLLAEKTPITRTIAAGAHSIVLRQNGVDVWRQQLVAEPDADHEFRPVFTEEKKRERQRRVGNPVRERTVAEPTPTPLPQATIETPPTEPVTSPVAMPPPIVEPPPPPPTPPEPTTPRTVGPPTTPAPTTSRTVGPPTPNTPVPGNPATPVPGTPVPGNRATPVPGNPATPVMVAPTAVKRLSGETPTLGASRPDQMPSVVAAKVCIDTKGTVTSVDIISKLERHTTSDLARTIRGWRYAPYHQGGAAVPACFSVNFRVK